jgi:hypothetical protein
MALAITPAVDKWLYQTDAFTIIFKAYDDNGVQCRNNQMAIKYGITYDGSMPDLMQMEKVYGDASGLIALVITKPCVISVFGEYAHDVNDPSKGTVTQEIAINYEITFQPIILKMYAEYVGPDIQVTNDFNGADVIVKAEYSDGSIQQIPTNACIIPDYQICKVGENIKSLTYTEPALGTIWNLDFVVIGIPKLLSIEAQYIGERRVIGDRVFPEEIVVYGTFLISMEDTEKTEIPQDEWFFINIPIITEDNDGIFRLKYKKIEIEVSVPYDIVNSLRLNVWYEGAKIEVGNTYNPDNVIVYLVYPNGDRKRISWKHCQINSYLVTQEGWNWFTITYTTEFIKVTQEFPVEGIILKKYIDLDFKVLYILDKTSDREEDQMNVTKEFKKGMSFDDILIVDWNQFLKIVNLSSRYGLYIVTVPKSSGMSNRFDMDWEVLCINKNTIKANIKKIYDEEE